MSPQKAKINKEVLNKIITAYQLTMEELALKTQTSEELISKWLDVNTKELPTWTFIEKVANLTLYPLPFFFFPFVVEDYLKIENITKDFRKNKEVTPELRAILVEAKNIIEEYKELTELKEKDFVGAFTIDQEKKIIEYIKQNFFVPKHPKTKRVQTYLQKQIEKLEEKGFLVIQKGFVGNSPNKKLPGNIIAGFAIPDKKAPLIFINTNLTQEAQIFTLFHELTHILLGEAASDTYLNNQNVKTEKLCDKVAAALLIPPQKLKNLWKQQENKNIHEKIKEIAQYFLVSKSAVVYNARQLNLISDKFFKEFFNTSKEIQRKKTSGKKDSPVPITIRTYQKRFGKNYVETLINAVYDGKISYRQASKMLKINYHQLQKVL